MHVRVYTDKDVIFTLATMIGKFAEMKASEKKINLPCSAVARVKAVLARHSFNKHRFSLRENPLSIKHPR